uniref:Beta-1,4-N-acetylgalactosaminyltransferase n=1 Tax=Parascaris univalens TaxID=6257 RepID=A0A915CHC5_PARUN
MVENVRAQSKLEIILEDSTILEDERRTATSFDPRNGSIVAEIAPISSLLSWLRTPKYDISRVLDALKNLNNPISENEFRTSIEKISTDSRFRCYCLLYRNILPSFIILDILAFFILLYSIDHGIHFVIIFVIFWCIISAVAIFLVILWRRNMRVRMSECFRVVNRSLSAHNLIAGVWDCGLWPYRKVLIILLRYRIRDCVPTVERAFFARWAANGNGRVDIESAERKDRSLQLLLSESNEYIGALAKGVISLSSFPKDDGRPNHSQLTMCLCRFVINRNFLIGSQAPMHIRMRRVFATPSLITSIVHAL